MVTPCANGSNAYANLEKPLAQGGVNDKPTLTTLVRPNIAKPFRYEVTARGASWIWRRGSREQREGFYGGMIETLPEWRRAEYERNKERRNKKKTGGVN